MPVPFMAEVSAAAGDGLAEVGVRPGLGMAVPSTGVHGTEVHAAKSSADAISTDVDFVVFKM
jgi:hypothetical protein